MSLMPTSDSRLNLKRGDYLHSSHEEAEAERLRLFNLAYGPTTSRVLSNYIKEGSSVLELGVGTDEIGKWIVKEIGTKGYYVGADKDPIQIERSKQNIVIASNIYLIKANVLSLDSCEELKKLTPPEGFKVIYCRWLLCHILDEERVHVIKQITSFLADGGVFICEEPDYRSMCLYNKGIQQKHPAIEEWLKLIPALQKNLGLNLTLDPEAILQEFNRAITDKKEHFSTEIIESFTGELVGEQKYGLVLGIHTAKNVIIKFCQKSEKELDELVVQLKEIADNPDITVMFYLNTFGKLTKIKKSL